MPPLKKWAVENKVTSSPHIAAEQCLDSIKDYFECSICRDQLDRPIQTKCGHVFCSKCLQDLSKEPNATCPLCKVKISNRSLIVREDVDDMKSIIARLSDAFTSELEKYFDWKVKPVKKSNVGSTEVVAKKIDDTPKAGTSSKTSIIEFQDGTENGSSSHNMDAVTTEDKRQKTQGKTQRIKSSRKSKEGRTSIDIDDLEQRISDGESGSSSSALKQNSTVDSAAVEPGNTRSNKLADVIPDVQLIQSNENLNIGSNETFGCSRDLMKDIGSKELDRNAVLEKIRKQTYVIMDSGIETVPVKNKSLSPAKPLDLSLSRRRSAQSNEYVYKEKPVTIRYVKPMDLSMKTDKRKFENDNFATSLSKTNSETMRSVPHSSKPDCYGASPQSPKRKRGKFEDNYVFSNDREPQASTLQSSSTSKRNSVEVGYEVDFETRREGDEASLDDNIYSVFTPTPPPVKNLNVSKKKEATLNSAKKTVRPSQFNIESQVMKAFDLPFEDDEMDTYPNPSSAGKVTSSDELFSNITEDAVIRGVKGRSQLKSGQSQASAKISKGKEQFVFKQPSGSIPQSSKKKQKEGQSKKNDIFMDCDDEFQQPRDSDFMFLDLTCDESGIRKGGGDQAMKHNSNDLSPSSEKENSGRESSLSKSGSRTTTPVKAAPSNVNVKIAKSKSLNIEDMDLKKGQMLKPSNDPVEAFGNDDEDEDWLLDIPMDGESRKKMSGKTKRLEDEKATEVQENAPSVSIVPLKSLKQRYVFCPTRLSKQQTLKLQQLCKMCDGIITKDFTPEVTHLIINLVAGRVPQTLKYLLAIAGRKWVVIYDWVEECVKAGELVSEDQFETSNYKQCDPGVRRSRLAKRNLFDGFKFYFATEHYKTMGFTKEEVSKLMETLGGTIVDSPKDSYRDLIIIGSKNGNSTDYNHWLHTNKWATVTFEWVIGCILEYRLKQFDPNFLCIDVTDVKSINAPKTFQTAFSHYLTQVSQAMSPA